MKGMRQLGAMLLIAGVGAMAQTPVEESDKGANAPGPWSFAITGDAYLVPQDADYGMAVFSADHKHVHLEGRYNYEEMKTGSVWTGYNFETGNKLTLSATPMIGCVFGNTAGVAPGYEISLGYKRIELSVDGEFVFDLKHSDSNFFYSWTELGYAPEKWVRFGLVAQRTKVYHTGLDVQRGVFVGFFHKRVDFTSYVLNAGWTDPTLVFEVGVTF